MYADKCSNAIYFIGRWGFEKDFAQTVSPGASIEINFEGDYLLLHFNIDFNQQPFPHLWICIDNGVMTEVTVDRFIRINTENLQSSRHTAQIIFKGAVECQARWYSQLTAKISFMGAEADVFFEVNTKNRNQIEFIGDSITEGILIDAERRNSPIEANNRVYQDDVCASYGWLTDRMLNMGFVNCAFGATGTTRAGSGSVPPADEAYMYNYNGSQITHRQSKYVVINHGTNDAEASAEEYERKYRMLLKSVREYNPKAKIIAMSPFNGTYEHELERVIEKYNTDMNEKIIFVNSSHWIASEPLHPMREGHRAAANELTKVIKNL